jgi:hypothetical protein
MAAAPAPAPVPALVLSHDQRLAIGALTIPELKQCLTRAHLHVAKSGLKQKFLSAVFASGPAARNALDLAGEKHAQGKLIIKGTCGQHGGRNIKDGSPCGMSGNWILKYNGLCAAHRGAAPPSPPLAAVPVAPMARANVPAAVAAPSRPAPVAVVAAVERKEHKTVAPEPAEHKRTGCDQCGQPLAPIGGATLCVPHMHAQLDQLMAAGRAMAMTVATPPPTALGWSKHTDHRHAHEAYNHASTWPMSPSYFPAAAPTA